jgi:hypothetical protein
LRAAITLLYRFGVYLRTLWWPGLHPKRRFPAGMTNKKA